MAIIAEVLKELQRERERLDKAIGALRQLVGANHTGGGARAKAPTPTKRAEASKPGHTMSQSARRKIAAAQKARWTKWKAVQKKAA